MSYRYRLARATGKLNEVVEEDRQLLEALGSKLLSIEAGIRFVPSDREKEGHVNPWDVLSLDERAWDWIRPLLIELHQSRSLREPKKAAASS